MQSYIYRATGYEILSAFETTDPFRSTYANTLHLSLLNYTVTQIMLLTNTGPRQKSQYRIEQSLVCIEFHLARTTST